MSGPPADSVVGGIKVKTALKSLSGFSQNEWGTAFWRAALGQPDRDNQPLDVDNQMLNAGCLPIEPRYFPQAKPDQAPNGYIVTGTALPRSVTDIQGLPLLIRNCTLKKNLPIIFPIFNADYYYIPEVDYSEAPIEGRLTSESAGSLVESFFNYPGNNCKDNLFARINGVEVPLLGDYKTVAPFVDDFDISGAFLQLKDATSNPITLVTNGCLAPPYASPCIRVSHIVPPTPGNHPGTPHPGTTGTASPGKHLVQLTWEHWYCLTHLLPYPGNHWYRVTLGTTGTASPW
eukprot:gene3241-13263_t